MAVHPLRPATHRSLGRPLPHQLANGTRAHPKAVYTFNLSVTFGISNPFGLLSQTLGQVPTRYSPIRRSSPNFIPEGNQLGSSLDLHVLSTPPAFVLSQDQTLQLKFMQKGYAFCYPSFCLRNSRDQVQLLTLAVRLSRTRMPRLIAAQ